MACGNLLMTHLLNYKEQAGQGEKLRRHSEVAEEVLFGWGFWHEWERRWDWAGKSWNINCAPASPGCSLLYPCLSFPVSVGSFSLLSMGVYLHCAGLYVSKVIQQKLQVLPELFHWAECAFLTSAHIVSSHPFTRTICYMPAWASQHYLSTSCGCHLVYQ